MEVMSLAFGRFYQSIGYHATKATNCLRFHEMTEFNQTNNHECDFN